MSPGDLRSSLFLFQERDDEMVRGHYTSPRGIVIDLIHSEEEGFPSYTYESFCEFLRAV